MPHLKEDEKKKREKAMREKKRREEERERKEQEGRTVQQRGRPSIIKGGVMALSPTPEAPDATIAPSSIPNHIIHTFQHHTTPLASLGRANSMLGGVLTQEQSQETSGLRPGSVPPSTSPTSRRGPLSDSHGHMDVDLERDDVSAVMANINDFHINSATNTPVCHIPSRNHSGTPRRRRGPGSWKAQLKRRHSSSSIRSDRAIKRRRIQDQLMLATTNVMQTLSILYPNRAKSAPQSPQRTGQEAIRSYQHMLQRLQSTPESFVEIESHIQQPATHHNIPSAEAPMDINQLSAGQSDPPPYAELSIGNQRLRVSYPIGYQRDNPNATLRRLTQIAWPAIANLMVDLHAWYDDHAVWLYMCLIAARSGRRAAILSPLYTEMAPDAIKQRAIHFRPILINWHPR